ncbi:maltose/maltodextrin ABC transporter substrate-binding protein MalE [Sansalvadorimonas verongulae]|uniref:maltose/maltodextrin ABC transporter substrate-binding protein MalE n=1 Tax=Sansalvadorimonas verongulae TaxID=2172824 RepID=UPI0012BCCA9D|nr:maltose/maltodextrin ABC transporter substrate-binding protein MalE [Sansalvadorimonas verongulae]MTI13924.1 maltose/maltodextrin ABC transporter substrate-binding protein MalE [Sansalvadorimonas verongulae]
MFTKRNVVIASLCALVFLAVSMPPSSTFAKSDELLLWVGGDKAYNGIREVGERFTEDTGITVKVEIPENVTNRFQQSAASGGGPDIIFWAHDRYGEWAKSGILAPAKPSTRFKKNINPIAWDAMTWNGEIYGFPISMEAVSLIYNKDILPTPPKSYEEMFSLTKKLANRYPPTDKDKKGDKGITTIMWDQVQPYFTMPLLAADGGYIFKKTAKGYDIKHTGVNDAGAKAGAKMLVNMIDKNVTPRGVDYGVMESAFNNQETAMMVTGPWAWANLEKSGVNFGVAPLPTINGKPARAFVGVWGAALNNASKNKDLAREFLENYLLTVDGLKAMNKDTPLGVVANMTLMQEFKKDPRIAATYQNVVQGMLMPNIPEMGKFWSAMESALRNITSGRQEYSTALDDAAKRIVN